MCRSTSPSVLHVHQNVLAKNNHYADQNRALFSHLLAVNVLSSPGAGKTTLIQRLLSDQSISFSKEGSSSSCSPALAGVIVGDLATECDAEKLRQAGVPAVQITTGNLCHLEAAAVADAAKQLDLENLSLLIIENVGNLVCPAAYDLGEDLRMVLMSVTEGENKPLKYPTMFKSADVVVISKIDMAEAARFNRAEALKALSSIAPQAQVFEVSAMTGEGLESLYDFLKQKFSHMAAQPQMQEA